MRITKFPPQSKNNGVIKNFNKTHTTFSKRNSLLQYQTTNRKTKQQLLYDIIVKEIKNKDII